MFDKECIKKHKKEFDAWLNGAEIEIKMADGYWNVCIPEWNSGAEYRIKSNFVHYYNIVGQLFCGKDWKSIDNNFKYNLKEKVTCPDCLAIMNCQYPGLRQAIVDKEEFFVWVTPEQSKEVQEIAFSVGIKWASGENTIQNENEKYLVFTRYLTHEYCFYCTVGTDEYHAVAIKEFYIATDSFNAPMPEWAKVGAKRFYHNKLVEIIECYDENFIEIKLLDTGENFVTDVGMLSPAIFKCHYEYLAKMMPLAVREKSSFKITTVLSINKDEVWIAGKGHASFSIKKFCDNYSFPDGSEIGEWIEDKQQKGK